ncbi:putative receptor-like protein kinase [Tanacetum coccineum]
MFRRLLNNPTTGSYDVEAIRRARPEEITAAEWDKYIQYPGRWLAFEMRWQASDTQEYPSLIDSGVFPKDEDRRIYEEMKRLEATGYTCGNNNYTQNSTFKTNLDTSLSNLPTTDNGFGFYNLSTGQGIDRANSVALCRGDINTDVCLRCLRDIIANVRKAYACPNSIYASAIYEYCTLIFNNDTLLGNPETREYQVINVLGKNSTNVDLFYGALRPLMEKLRADASNGGPLRKFATGNTTVPDFTSIYGLMQCTPDISEQNCSACLEDIIRRIPSFIGGKDAGRILAPNCFLRYDSRLFFNESRPLVPSPTSSSSPSPSSLRGLSSNVPYVKQKSDRVQK